MLFLSLFFVIIVSDIEKLLFSAQIMNSNRLEERTVLTRYTVYKNHNRATSRRMGYRRKGIRERIERV
jgi:hypothetical protein